MESWADPRGFPNQELRSRLLVKAGTSYGYAQYGREYVDDSLVQRSGFVLSTTAFNISWISFIAVLLRFNIQAFLFILTVAVSWQRTGSALHVPGTIVVVEEWAYRCIRASRLCSWRVVSYNIGA